MSTALAYHEPYFFTAGALALLVHLAFFMPLYVATRWQSRPPEGFMVEMWDNLPNTEVVPEQKPISPAKMEPIRAPKVVAPVSPSVKADIEVLDKKSKKARQEAELKELRKYEANSERIRKAEQERIRAEVSVATKVQVERYRDLIINKIRRNRKEVADVPASAEAIFKVTLLPDGTLMEDPVLVKSSGFPAYDDAADRAIRSAEPLPVPTDISLQKMFRELKLSIKP